MFPSEKRNVEEEKKYYLRIYSDSSSRQGESSLDRSQKKEQLNMMLLKTKHKSREEVIAESKKLRLIVYLNSYL